jgi:hypothetical protein
MTSTRRRFSIRSGKTIHPKIGGDLQSAIPWIEVGEHAIGCKFPRLLQEQFIVRDPGLPTGADQRLLLRSNKISAVSKGLFESVWLFLDIKSVGPRDDFDHTVLSHNQVSGAGLWVSAKEGVKNTVIQATGVRSSHEFHCSLPPLYVLSNFEAVPLINFALKPIYGMLDGTNTTGLRRGQPLLRLTLASIPNGILLVENPGYLNLHKGLLFPGKDDKTKATTKVRARISFPLLRQIDDWRVQTFSFPATRTPERAD